jgi:hypothetical protein
MRKHLLLLGLALLCAVSTITAAQNEFMFGIWTSQEATEDTLSAFARMLHNTLHFNTVLGYCYKPTHLQAYADAELKVISSNDWRWNDTVAYWPRIYSDAAYSIFESEGTHIGCQELVFHGGIDSTFGATRCRYFAAAGNTVDSVIQSGPEVPDTYSPSCGYAQAGWYYPQHLPQNTDVRYNYTATLRLRLGARPPQATNDTVAVFYIYRFNMPDESYLG